MILLAAPALPHFSNWENFYVIVGSSAGALIGLQFVVLTLIAETGRTSSRQISAFGSPTVTHFSASLLIAALMSAPWESLAGARAVFGLFGILGIAYTFRTIVHALHQHGYVVESEDWFWYFALPLIAYSVLFLAAFLLIAHTSRALFLVASVAVTLLFNGIHNSWDTVTYIVTSDVLKAKKANGNSTDDSGHSSHLTS